MDLLTKDIFAALPSTLGAAAIAPSMLVLWTIASMDNRREPARVVLATFLFGAGGAFFLSYLRVPVPGISILTNWPIVQTYLHATFEVAAPEEAAKLIVLVFFCSRYIAYDHPMEGVVCGAAVGLGFAAYENLFYLANNPDYWKTIAFMCGLLTVPVHGALGVIVGIYVAWARFGDRRRRSYGFRIKSDFTGWGIATALHGLVRFPALAAATASTGPKRQRSFVASNWHHRGRLSIGGRGTYHLSSQEIASHLAKFFYDRTSVSKPSVALD